MSLTSQIGSRKRVASELFGLMLVKWLVSALTSHLICKDRNLRNTAGRANSDSFCQRIF